VPGLVPALLVPVPVLLVGVGVADGLDPVSVGVGVGVGVEVSDGLADGLAVVALAVGLGAAVLAAGLGLGVAVTTGAADSPFGCDLPATGWLGLIPSGVCQGPGEAAVPRWALVCRAPGDPTELAGERTVCCTVRSVTTPTVTMANTADTASTGRSQG
jgi:hypothetical protein